LVVFPCSAIATSRRFGLLGSTYLDEKDDDGVRIPLSLIKDDSLNSLHIKMTLFVTDFYLGTSIFD
jgi:hypothetical protein